MSLTYKLFGIPQTIGDFVDRMKKDKKTDVNLEFRVKENFEGKWFQVYSDYYVSGGLISNKVKIDSFEGKTYFASFFGEDNLKFQAISKAEYLAQELKRKYGFDVTINAEPIETFKGYVEDAFDRAVGTGYASLGFVR